MIWGRISSGQAVSAGVQSGPPQGSVLLGISVIGTVALWVGIHELPLGPLATSMALHILLMNIAAPVFVAIWLFCRSHHYRPSGRVMWIASTIQIGLLCATHLPGIMASVHSGSHSTISHAAFQAILFLASLWFWLTVLAQGGNARWRALLALLLTGKIFCLIGILLVFAPRNLYGATLADQQQAGLLMVSACPLTYVLVAIVITARWLRDISQEHPQGQHREYLYSEGCDQTARS